jgi:hypothetical protein
LSCVEEKRTANTLVAVHFILCARQSIFVKTIFGFGGSVIGEKNTLRWIKRTASKIFAVRFLCARQSIFEKTIFGFGGRVVGEENTLLCAVDKTHGKQALCRVFFLCCALYKICTANKLFAVRPK